MSKALAEEGVMHMSINPSNLMIDENGTIKLIDDLVLEKPQSLSRECPMAFSPGELQAKKLFSDKKIFWSKCVVWAIGLTSLCAATCSDLSKFYDYSRNKIKEEVVLEKLESLKGPPEPYSEQLVEIITKCLRIRDEIRMDLDDLQRMLLPFSLQRQNSDVNQQTRRPSQINYISLGQSVVQPFKEVKRSQKDEENS